MKYYSQYCIFDLSELKESLSRLVTPIVGWSVNLGASWFDQNKMTSPNN